MKLTTLALVLAATASLIACDERPTVSTSGSGTSPAAPPGPTPMPSPTPPPTPDTTPRATKGASSAGTATAQDSKANDPTGALTKEEESAAMPKAGQANNHSSPSLEKGKP